MTPVELVEQARRLLEEPTPATVSGWSRAAALLARQALELQLREFWSVRLAGAERLNMRAQLNCARVYLDSEIAGELAYAWYALSRATHHHPYELDPTREELASLLGAVAVVNARVKAKCAADASSASDTPEVPEPARHAQQQSFDGVG